MDPLTVGISVTIGAAVIGMFFRIEHRLTKVETTLAFIQEHMTGCQPTSDENMK